jgi:hypothetical protein
LSSIFLLSAGLRRSGLASATQGGLSGRAITGGVSHKTEELSNRGGVRGVPGEEILQKWSGGVMEHWKKQDLAAKRRKERKK